MESVLFGVESVRFGKCGLESVLIKVEMDIFYSVLF